MEVHHHPEPHHDLLKRVCTVSVETMKIIKQMPYD